MQLPAPAGTSLPDAELLSVLVANGVPVVGLLAFDTAAAALLTFYWLELGVLAVWATVRATFAGRRSGGGGSGFTGARRATLRVLLPSRLFDPGTDDAADGGGWADVRLQIPRTDVGIYLGTVPALAVIVPLLAFVWIGFGGVVVGPVVAATAATDLPTWVLTGAGAVFLTEGGRTVAEYFYGGRHRDTTAWMAVNGIFWQGVVLAGAGLLVVVVAFEFAEGEPVSTESAARAPLVVVAVAGKFLIDLTTYSVDGVVESLREAL